MTSGSRLDHWWALALSGILFICGILLPEAVGVLQSDYDSARHFLSELGAYGAEYAGIINFLGFLPVAVVSVMIAVSLRARFSGYRIAQTGLLLVGAGIFIGYLGAFLFPCDHGCPAQGSSRQAIHNLAGAAEYVVVLIGLLMLGIGLSNRSFRITRALVVATAILVITGFLMMLDPAQSDVRGLWQRSADYSMFALLIILSANRSLAGARARSRTQSNVEEL
jgi:hypothetical protein